MYAWVVFIFDVLMQQNCFFSFDEFNMEKRFSLLQDHSWSKEVGAHYPLLQRGGGGGGGGGSGEAPNFYTTLSVTVLFYTPWVKVPIFKNPEL